jgi:3D (Asp-Asp-Asp) domain-containing protein
MLHLLLFTLFMINSPYIDYHQVVTISSKDNKEYETYEVTAYTAGPESTGKSPSHPLYGITASTKRVKENHSIACPRSLEFGTQIYIPFFDNTFTCEDRGGAIKEGKIDVYMPEIKDALEFGRKDLEVLILEDRKKQNIHEALYFFCALFYAYHR